MIERKGYTRKYGSRVRAAGFTVRRSGGKTFRIYPSAKTTFVESRCVKDMGKPGKGPQAIGPLRKGELQKHGYSWVNGEESRHHALKKAVSEFGPLSVYRKLDAVAKLTKRTGPRASAVFRKDREWVRAYYRPLKAL